MRVRQVLWALVALGVVAGLWSFRQRYAVEARNRAVEIAVDVNELRDIAAAEGKSLADVLARFKAAGASSVVVGEDTLGSLERQRRLEVVATNRRDITYLFVHQGLFARLRDHLKHRTRIPISLPPGFENVTPADAGIDIPALWTVVESQGVGLDPDVVALCRKEGLAVVGRVNHTPNITPEGIRWVLSALKKQGVSTVLFSGDEILGFPDRLADTAAAMADPAVDLHYGAVEFGKQKGDPTLARLLPERVVRVHTITAAEMQTVTRGDALQRFSLALRERNIRLAFVRLFLGDSNPLESNAGYIAGIRQAAIRGGLSVGVAHGFPDLAAPFWLRGLIGVGIAAGLALLLDAVAGVLAHRTATLAAGGLGVLVVALAAAPIAIAVKAAALLAGCAFPALGLVRNDLLAPAPDGAAPLPTALRRFGEATAVTLAGIVLTVGLLADRVFLVKADAFLGVKLTLAVPLAVAALVYGLGLRAESPAGLLARARRLVEQGREALAQPIFLWQALAALTLLALVAVILMRSDNDPGIGVSALELKVRALLDRVFGLRPRFKDLAFHPALLAGLLLGLRGRRAWALPLVVLGAFGQSSLLNAFCHLHTPLLVCAARDAIGLGLGGLIGVGVLMGLERVFAPKPRP